MSAARKSLDLQPAAPAGPAEARSSARRPGFRSFWTDRRGVAAVEFAFILPLLVCMYFVTMEISQAIETSKKASRVGSMVADLITQQQKISKSEVQAVIKIGVALLKPYNRSPPNVFVTAIQIGSDGVAKVAWSQTLENGTYKAGPTAGTVVTVPDKLKIANTFLVKVQSSLPYKPVMVTKGTDSEKQAAGLAALVGEFNMGGTYYLRPRMSDTVPCGDC